MRARTTFHDLLGVSERADGGCGCGGGSGPAGSVAAKLSVGLLGEGGTSWAAPVTARLLIFPSVYSGDGHTCSAPWRHGGSVQRWNRSFRRDEGAGGCVDFAHRRGNGQSYWRGGAADERGGTQFVAGHLFRRHEDRVHLGPAWAALAVAEGPGTIRLPKFQLTAG